MSSEIDRIVAKACLKKGIRHYTVGGLSGNDKGEGFLGEINFLTVTDKDNDEDLHLVVKKSFTDETARKIHPLRLTFLNEIYFYTQVWPRLDKMQENVGEKLRVVPELLAFSDVDKEEMVVLKNLKKDDFELYDKRKPLDKEHLSKIFSEYGKLHALSAALKKLDEEEYNKLTDGIVDMCVKFVEQSGVGEMVKINCKMAESCLKDNDEPGFRQFVENLTKNGDKIYNENLICTGKNSLILHGDVWVSNQMFRYDENRRLVDIKLLDFQISRVGSPVQDLSYCVYSGGSKEIYDNLESYLEIYLQSFRAHYTEIVGEGPSLSLEHLKKEWLLYHKFGYFCSLLIWKIKATKKEDVVEITESEDITDFLNTAYDKEFFKDNVRPLLLFVYKLDTQGW